MAGEQLVLLGLVPTLKILCEELQKRVPGLVCEIGFMPRTKPAPLERIIFVLERGAFGGGIQRGDYARVLRFRNPIVRAEIRARKPTTTLYAVEDMARAEELLRNLVVVLDEQCPGDFTMQDEDWGVNRDDVSQFGVGCDVTFTLKVPVTDDPYQYAQVEELEETAELDKSNVITKG